VAKQAREPASSGPLLQTTTTITTKKTKVKMSTRVQKIILSGLMAGCISMTAKADGQGTDHGFFWSLWHTGGSDSISFPGAGTYPGNFQINYSNVGDVVGGKGWNPGSSHSIGYNIGVLSGGYNFVGIYGWTTSPLIEYYVCEKGAVGGTFVNTMSSDGHNYNFYKHQQISQPSIQGTQTFWQYMDNWGGGSTGVNGSVNMGNHINNWRNRGGQGFGSFNYQILALEAYGTKSGSINATVWGQ
jgi:endo-1,4-beta-xylanase